MSVSDMHAMTVISFFFMDLEEELGKTLDWICGMAADEDITVGSWIGQVCQQYRDDFEAQENRERNLSRNERKLARIAAQEAKPGWIPKAEWKARQERERQEREKR